MQRGGSHSGSYTECISSSCSCNLSEINAQPSERIGALLSVFHLFIFLFTDLFSGLLFPKKKE